MEKYRVIFDADIIINSIKNMSITQIVDMFDIIYIADYVYSTELQKEHIFLSAFVKNGKVEILKESNLECLEKRIYKDAKKVLKSSLDNDFLQMGEYVTACFAQAYGISYFMSDDNKASIVLEDKVGIEIVNYVDILYLMYKQSPQNIKKIKSKYDEYLEIFDEGCIPRKLKKNGKAIDFVSSFNRSNEKFNKNTNLKKLCYYIENKDK